MKTKWYRSRGIKGLLLVLAHAAAAAAAICGIMLFQIYSNGGNPFDSLYKDRSSYLESDTFGQEFFSASQEIIQQINWLSVLDKAGENPLIDLGEPFLQPDSITFRNTSGLAYSLTDLTAWANESWDYDYLFDDGNNIIVCVRPDGKQEYFYYKDLRKKLDSEQLSFSFDTSYLNEYGVSKADITGDVLQMLQHGQLAEGTLHSGIKAILDSKGNVVYEELQSYTGYSISENYKPDGADSILEVLNTSSSWNGRLEDAFSALNDALLFSADLGGASTKLARYAENETNLTYFYMDKASRRFYTNDSSLSDTEKSLDKLRAMGAYAIFYPNISQCEMNFSSTEAFGHHPYVAPALRFVSDSAPDKDFVFALGIDTDFPVEDAFSTGSRNYEESIKYAPPLLKGLTLSLVILIACFLWLTAAAGRKSRDEELHLCFFDSWFTEISAVLVFCVWFFGSTLLLHGLSIYGIQQIVSFFDYALAGAIGVWTALWFSIGWLSLVRRIKAKTLWKNSLLRWLLGWFKVLLKKIKGFLELYSRNTGSKIKLTLGLGCFLILQFFFSIIVLNAPLFFIVLFLIDAAVLAYGIRKAAGQERILEGLKRISGGELQYKIPLDGMTGEQKTMAEYINNIGDGLDAAVDSSLKNERMKTELITNVSHDIKTPLTSIINYVDLLKRENFTDPRIVGYLDILEEKAQRLKVLTEDVVEASKASTGNISLEMTELDFMEMVQQVIGEFEEKFQEKHLTMMVHFSDEPSVIYADGQRMWRVLENIFNNVSKYALEGTRVYAEVKNANQKVFFSLKNISASPLNFSADELTERFIRGDVSRNTEGSGLGLSIAKSLTELQGGEFKLYLDGDLFKVTITFAAR